jgi:hypothetical protein
MERGRYKQERNTDPLTIEEIRKMEYAGGGYFREKLPRGQSARILHGPEIQRILSEEIDRLNGEIEQVYMDMAGEDI